VSAATYTARAIKSTALTEETRRLLRAWQPGLGAAELRRSARTEDLLGKATGSRADDIVQFSFAARYLADGDEPAATVKRLLDLRGFGPWFAQLGLLFAARNDVVLAEAITVFLSDVRQRQVASTSSRDFVAFLTRQEEAGRMAKAWSPSVKESVAQHVMHQLTDAGVLGTPRRGLRPLQAYRAGEVAIAFLACELHRKGVSDAALVAHPDWRIWQMPEDEVRAALERLGDLGLWMIQAAGEVVRISWRWSRWDEVVAVLARCSDA
jgi:hypothetical protein